MYTSYVYVYMYMCIYIYIYIIMHAKHWSVGTTESRHGYRQSARAKAKILAYLSANFSKTYVKEKPHRTSKLTLWTMICRQAKNLDIKSLKASTKA